MKHYRSFALAACLSAAGVFAAYGSTGDPINPQSQSDIASQVQQKLASLPYYTVFDSLGFRVDGTQVTSTGQVVNPALPDEAKSAVMDVSGVTTVIDQLHILPRSFMDAGIRRAVLRAIYGAPALQRYGEPVVPSIHIIVDSGTVTLMGMVATQGDRTEAYLRAMSVPGTFGVINDLIVNLGV